MNKSVRYFLFGISLSVAGLLNSCKKDEPKLPDNIIAFESDQLGISPSEDSLVIPLSLSRTIQVDAHLVLTLDATGVTYGTDFATMPALTSNSLSVTVNANSTTASVTLKKIAGVLFDGDEIVKFTIQSADQGLIVGDKGSVTVAFSEIVAPSGTMEINGGGSLFPNKVFIDLSGNRQTAVARSNWDLLFSGTSDYRVLLNSANGMMARALDKNDLNMVNSADTVGWGAQLSLAAVFAGITSPEEPDWVPNAIGWIDDPAGDLTKTVIASISSADADNKVYIVNRGTSAGNPAPARGWKKIRIVRTSSGYTLQQADINATSFTETTIVNDPLYRFQYVSFDNGVSTVEPAEAKWDFAWTGFTNSTDFGSGPVPYYFQDIILQNISGVQTAQVLTSTITYELFAESNIDGLTFNTGQLSIGSSWRAGGGPTTSPSIKTDRFYVIKDSDGNYYKVQFTSLTTDGERGKPQLKFALVKKGQ